ncbi:ornithine cyclodeaminase [Serratia plymuthica]|uniref:Ornithine cyclodeaminase n=1 Tax=Serratia plymuthica TaxID=82996 RepID=A0A2X4U8C4_SERPL|nr:ornithine cyclodeaminase [Serratia plymuthica]
MRQIAASDRWIIEGAAGVALAAAIKLAPEFQGKKWLWCCAEKTSCWRNTSRPSPMKIINQQQIIDSFDADSITSLLKSGFIAYSRQQVQQPPVQHFLFEQAAGDCCIKSAWLEGDEQFVVKVSAGFYRNPAQGLASNQGLLMAFSALTGEPQALLLDEGWLTALRTALAGRIAAELCARRTSRRSASSAAACRPGCNCNS